MNPVRLATPSAWQAWRRVIAALIVRETAMRFGVYRLGLAWAVLEPAAHVAVLLAVLGVAARTLMPTGDPVAFAFIGVCAYLTLRSGLERGAGALESARTLLSFRQVTPAALVIARSAVEQGTLLAVLVAGLLALGAWSGPAWPDPLQFALAWLALAALTLGLALVTAVAAAFMPALRKLLTFGLRGLYLVSGVFFPLSAVNAQTAELLAWNPLAQVIELAREAALGWPAHASTSLAYVWGWALVSVFAGLALMRVLRRELEPA